MVLVALATICVLLYFCIRYRRRRNRQRRWILKMGGAPEVAQGWGRSNRAGRRRSDGDGDARYNPWLRASRQQEDPIWGRLEEIVNSGPKGVQFHRSPAAQHQPQPVHTTTFLDPSKFEDVEEFPLAPVHKAREFTPRYTYTGPQLQPSRPAPTFPGAAAARDSPRKKRDPTDFLPPMVVQHDDGLSDVNWDDPIVRLGDDASNHKPSKWHNSRSKETSKSRQHEDEFASGKPLYRPGQDVTSILKQIS